MSYEPFGHFFAAVEAQMRACGHGDMVDRALTNARISLLRVLRAELLRRRERQYIKGLIQEALMPSGRSPFGAKPPFPGARH